VCPASCFGRRWRWARGSRCCGARRTRRIWPGQPARSRRVGPTRARRVFGAARFVAGAALVGLGLASFLLFSPDAASAARGLSGGAVVVGGAALIAGPWLLRIWHSLSAERAERIRSQAHADLAAHLHDSVLQTLALIQRQAHDPRAVMRLARGQERDLRTFLYAEQPGPDGEESVAVALRRVCAEVEESVGVPVELVTVGDGSLDEARWALVAPPGRRWSMPPSTPGHPGSTCTRRSTPPARACSSGIGASGSTRWPCPRTARASATRSSGGWRGHGGRAEVRSSPGAGTEVELRLPG